METESTTRSTPAAVIIGRMAGRTWARKWVRYSVLGFAVVWGIYTLNSKEKPTEVPAVKADKPEPAKSSPEQTSAQAKQHITDIEVHLKEHRESLRKFYGSASQVNQSSQDLMRLTIIAVEAKQSKDKEDVALAERANALVTQVAQQTRILYASSMEENFIKAGLDAKISADGAQRDQLTVRYALMSKPLVYKFQNEMNLDDQARKFGFKRVVYTNGFESSLGKTWSINL